MMWFYPAMIWKAAPTVRRGREQSGGDFAIQTCLSMLSGLARPDGTMEPVDGSGAGVFGLPAEMPCDVPDQLRLDGLEEGEWHAHRHGDAGRCVRHGCADQWRAMNHGSGIPSRGNAGDPSRRCYRQPHRRCTGAARSSWLGHGKPTDRKGHGRWAYDMRKCHDAIAPCHHSAAQERQAVQDHYRRCGRKT